MSESISFLSESISESDLLSVQVLEDLSPRRPAAQLLPGRALRRLGPAVGAFPPRRRGVRSDGRRHGGSSAGAGF